MERGPIHLADRRVAVRAGVDLKTYTLYIHDDRYSVPSLDAITVRDDARAREMAQKRLATSPHYRIVELWEDERFLDQFERA